MKKFKSLLNKPEGTSVLISGGSGLVGKYLTSLLLAEGYTVSHLSRNTNQFGKVRVFRWDPAKAILDPLVFDGVDYVIHLAGANIGEKRWSVGRKKEIISSRIDSARLLYETVSNNNIKLKAFISASAIGYYGLTTSDKIYIEDDLPATDFLGSTCRLWEEAADMFTDAGIRTVKIRTAVVLEKSDSALAKLLKPASFGIFPVLGTGRQYMPWIHIDDLVSIYLKAINDDKMSGPYNAVAPHHITQLEFMRALALSMNKTFFHPPVPAIFLQMVLGRMATVALKGSRISSERMLNDGFAFKFNNVEAALTNVLNA